MKFKIILIIIIAALSGEIALRLSGPPRYDLQHIRPFEEYFQYDPYFGWVGKPDYSMHSEFFGDMHFDNRGFAVLPAIANDTVRNDTKILYLGACYTYGGPMLGPSQGFISLLAKDLAERADFDAIGIMGYNFYQQYLLNKKYNDGSFSVVVASITPTFDFYLDTTYYLHNFGNRRVPRPIIRVNEITHTPVSFVGSYWGPKEGIADRLSFKEKIFSNSYLVSALINAFVERISLNPPTAQHILMDLRQDVEANGGMLVVLIFNLMADQDDPKLDRITDEFLAWMDTSNFNFIDLRQQLKGHSFIDKGDPFHFNLEGQKIIKNELRTHLENIEIFDRDEGAKEPQVIAPSKEPEI